MNIKHTYMNEETGGEAPAPGGAAPVTPAETPAPAAEGNWYDGYAEDIRSNQNITKFESHEELAKSYINAQRLIGAEKIPMPTTDDDWSNVYSRLGRPDEANMYTIDAVEGYEVDQTAQDAFKEFAHSKGLSQDQVQALAAWDMQRSIDGSNANSDASKLALDEATGRLKSEWGEAHGQNVNIAARAASEFMGDEGKAFFDNAIIDGIPAGEHPALLKLFHSVGKGMMESSKLEGIANEGKQTPQEIQDDISALMSNPAYTDKRHPEHAAVFRKVQSLFQLKAG